MIVEECLRCVDLACPPSARGKILPRDTVARSRRSEGVLGVTEEPEIRVEGAGGTSTPPRCDLGTAGQLRHGDSNDRRVKQRVACSGRAGHRIDIETRRVGLDSGKAVSLDVRISSRIGVVSYGHRRGVVRLRRSECDGEVARLHAGQWRV